MGFAAVMPGTGRCGSLGTPSVHSKLGIPTSNHEPVHGCIGHDSTDFTSEFLLRCHLRSVCQWSGAGRPYSAGEVCRELDVSTVNSPTCSLFTVPRRWA